MEKSHPLVCFVFQLLSISHFWGLFTSNRDPHGNHWTWCSTNTHLPIPPSKHMTFWARSANLSTKRQIHLVSRSVSRPWSHFVLTLGPFPWGDRQLMARNNLPCMEVGVSSHSQPLGSWHLPGDLCPWEIHWALNAKGPGQGAQDLLYLGKFFSSWKTQISMTLVFFLSPSQKELSYLHMTQIIGHGSKSDRG